MNLRLSLRVLQFAGLLFLATTLPAYATAVYNVSITGDLTIDSPGGDIGYAPFLTQPDSTSTIVSPSGGGTAVATADFTEFTPIAADTIRVNATANGTAEGVGSTSFATGSVGGGLSVTNLGTSPVPLFINVDIDWAWTLLLDDPVKESASIAFSLALYADGQFVATLIDLLINDTIGSDSLVTTVPIDLNYPDLATLDSGQTRLFSIVASATGNANTVPEPSTLALFLSAGLVGLVRISRRRLVG